MMPETLSVALWALNVGAPLADLDAYVRLVDARLAEATAGGADLLVMPEYACEPFLWFAPRPLARPAELQWLAARAAEVLPRLAPLAARHGTALLAGALPVWTGTAHRNRAHLFLPDGRAIVQDKLALLPLESNPQGYLLERGGRFTIVGWQGLRLAIAVCLDVELPALAARLADRAIDLLLVPSMTERASGFARVAACARARAVELMTTVCIAGCVGTAGHPNARPNVGGAAAYLPCEMALGGSGVAARLGPIDAAEGPGPLLIARDLPVGRIRELRRSGAEAWPGAWSAYHVKIEER